MDEEPKSLQILFSSAKAQKKSLESAPNTNDEAYQDQLDSTLQLFETCHKLIAKLSLFSPNESLEDITTADLQFGLPHPLSIRGLICDGIARSDDRLKNAQRVRERYEAFLELLDQYGILPAADKKFHEQYLESPDTFSLAPANDAAARRNVKVARFREEKELKQKLEYLSQNQKPIEHDDETVRRLQLAEIHLYVHQTFQALDMLTQEVSMLKAAQLAAATRPQRVPQDAREYKENDIQSYSDRLDVGLSSSGRGRGSPLLNKAGVPLQPFVLTSRRTEIRKGVFRPGHNLPTMTIEDYLEEERRRGGIIEGGGEQSGIRKEIDEDDMEKANEETMKARAWDEFKEENPRGSGNTLNRG
ncbi:Type 2A phosphatase-associated protein 42 [Ophidiomyces ophidiicola]|uniref:Type 2A phosphatase-associated protein 42 n=1 Tax=Ophidiomyces ophidiicola TaxID=1387563 RepID=A0ACB8UV42_9EURO|nr:Type 2A phosphatase-associated protein 42 [Ophidiomyces ophidiicola]KAI1916607.1 Type 2A phosphatase-associated protein 42 [Ophidiomyces ophidiicola]KAI1918348.1 Type 2A phosphatase-associated protein 42 [Ophidiomyces ophidiicola]KAI1945002.1 Type 2A phosphatase-associated protein 42 [Ophidiomyces ophidiicola]KAI1945115.1 Type 2A phosphatase-associated protein 42 [Ophidiomyces ophidiicola]KAI1947394.1 Type 2A phosphatase-associated protein 42 [Ophidiomyces ophidiicola]